MTLLQAIILGIVQGLTEFIPVSSTAHLVFAARLVDLYGGVDKTLQAQQTTATIAVIQLGTLLAVLVYFAPDIVNILRAFVGDHLALLRGRTVPQEAKLSREAWLGWLVIIGSLPVGVFGLLFKKHIEGTFTKNLWVIATMMIVVGVLLAFAELVGKRNRDMSHLQIRDALLRVDNHGWSVLRADPRNRSKIFLSTVHSGHCSKRPTGAEGGNCKTPSK